jgi:tripartite-type tricarboxylate transporter receptor subunit TctC
MSRSLSELGRRRRVLLLAMAGCSTSLYGVAQTQQFPDRPIRLVIPFPPGGGADSLARPLAERLKRNLGQTIVIENRSGGGSNIGTEAVARARPDGYTLLLNTDAIAIYPHLYRKLGYQVFEDLVPIGYVASSPLVLAINPAVKAGNLQELIALARREPNKLNFAMGGVGTPHHLAFELFVRQADVKIGQIPYRGGGPALADVLAGHVEVGVFTLGAVTQHVSSGALRPMAIMADRRTDIAPAIPSLEELGVKGVRSGLRYVLMAPRATPVAVVARLERAVAESLREAEVQQLLQQAGYEALSAGASEAASRLRHEHDTWGPILKTMSIQLDP